MICLDTSFLIHALAPTSPEGRALRGWVTEDIRLTVSAIAWAEFLCGPAPTRAIDAARRLCDHIIPFDERQGA